MILPREVVSMVSAGLRNSVSRFLLTLLAGGAIFVIAWARSPSPVVAQTTPDLCFAFLRQGNIWVHCNGKSETITRDERVYDFAISPDGSYLAIYKPSKGNQVVLVALKRDFAMSISPVHLAWPRLRSSCGTIAVSQTDGYAQDTYDAVTGEPIRPKQTSRDFQKPNGDFGCSSDRTIIVGFFREQNAFNKSMLVLATGGAVPSIAYLAPDVAAYAVSPSGRYTAYTPRYRVEGPLCLTQIDGEIGHSDCNYGTSGATSGADRSLSVSDGGELLYDLYKEDHCFYKDGHHYSRTKIEGYNDEGICPAIAYWRSGEKGETIVEHLATSPQWISEEQAASLREMSAQSQIKSRINP